MMANASVEKAVSMPLWVKRYGRMKRGESVSWQAEELKKLVEMGRPEKRFRSWHAFPLRGIYQSYLIIL